MYLSQDIIATGPESPFMVLLVSSDVTEIRKRVVSKQSDNCQRGGDRVGLDEKDKGIKQTFLKTFIDR